MIFYLLVTNAHILSPEDPKRRILDSWLDLRTTIRLNSIRINQRLTQTLTHELQVREWLAKCLRVTRDQVLLLVRVTPVEWDLKVVRDTRACEDLVQVDLAECKEDV